MSNKKFLKVVFSAILLFTIFLELFAYFLGKNIVFINSIIDIKYKNIDCIIAGDSHSANAFRDKIKTCSNISLGGTSIPMLVDIVSSARSSTDIKKVILSLDPHNFTDYRIKGTTHAFKDITNNALLIQNATIRTMLLEKMKSGMTLNKSRVWADLDGKERKESVEKRLADHMPTQNPSETEFFNIYLDFVKNLIDSSIDVCLVRAPVDYDYEKEIFDSFGDDWLKVANSFENIGAKYIDYRNLMEIVPKEYLSDQDHLNDRGSSVFAPLAFEACFLSRAR